MRFPHPRIEREGRTYDLDWCLVWENQCGKPAADAFCQEKGFAGGACEFQIRSAIGSPAYPTAIISEPGVYCPGRSPGHVCDGFKSIACARETPDTHEPGCPREPAPPAKAPPPEPPLLMP